MHKFTLSVFSGYTTTLRSTERSSDACRDGTQLGSGLSERFQSLGGNFQGQGLFFGFGPVTGVGADRAHASFAQPGDARDSMLNVNGTKAGFAWYFCPAENRTYWMGIWGN